MFDARIELNDANSEKVNYKVRKLKINAIVLTDDVRISRILDYIISIQQGKP